MLLKGYVNMGAIFNCIKRCALLALIAACATNAAQKPLVVWIMPNGASPQEILEQRLNLFTQKTGIPTKVQVLDWGEAWNRISGALEGKLPAPDVLQIGTTWIPYFASRGEIKVLNSELNQIKPERFVPVSWSTTHIDNDTNIYSVPWFMDIRPVLANKRILKANGIDRKSIATYDGFVKAIRKVNATDEVLSDGAHVRGYAFPGRSDWNIPHNFAPWIWSNGGSFIERDSLGKWHSSILTENSLRGIATYLHFIMDSLVAPEALQNNTAQIAQQFNNGELAFIVNTAEILMQTRFHGNKGGLSNSRIGNDSIAIIPFPKGKESSTSFIGGSNLAIPAKNTRKESLDILLFLINDTNLDAYTKQIGFLPPSKKVLKNWANDNEYQVLVNALETGRSYVAIPEWSELEQQFASMFSSIWEQMEIPSLYSEEKLYDIFKQYTLEIDKKLNYPTTNLMTLAEFKEAWNKTTSVFKPEAEVKTDTTKITTENSMNKAPIIFAVMVVLGFAFAFSRKRKK